MAFDYRQIRQLAEQQIKEYGRPITIKGEIKGTFDPTTGKYTGGSQTTRQAYGIVTAYARNEIDGTLIQAKDQKVLLAADSLSAPPEVGELLVVGSVEYRVVSVRAVEPGGTALLYKVQVRK